MAGHDNFLHARHTLTLGLRNGPAGISNKINPTEALNAGLTADFIHQMKTAEPVAGKTRNWMTLCDLVRIRRP